MSTGTALREPAAEAVGGGSVGSSLRAGLRRWRFWLILGAMLLAVVLATILGGGDRNAEPLSPDNPAPEGAMAAAEVLGQQGVQVHAAGSLEDALSTLAQADGGTSATLFLADPNGRLTPDQLQQLDGAAARTVLMRPGFEQLRVFAPDIRPAGFLADQEGPPLSASCDVADARAAGTIERGGFGYRGPVMCFGSDGPGGASASYVGSEDGTVVVLGFDGLLNNEGIAHEGNAALSLRTLGAHETLVWYQPTLADLTAAGEAVDPAQLLPDWVAPVLLWLLVVGVLAIFWQARRTGPLVAEPLPVVVRAAETAEGRARLYQDSRAIRRAAAILRASALTRLAAHLRLGPDSQAESVVQAVARLSSRPEHELQRLLVHYWPDDDARLVRWAQELEELEKEIRNR